MVAFHSETGKYGFLPLAEKDVFAGAPPPPEGVEEVFKFMHKRARDGNILRTDSSQAFRHVAKELREKGILTDAQKSHYIYMGSAVSRTP